MLRLWYMIDVPLHRADDLFLAVADVMIRTQFTLRDDAGIIDGISARTGMEPVMKLAERLPSLHMMGVVDEGMTA